MKDIMVMTEVEERKWERQRTMEDRTGEIWGGGAEERCEQIKVS